MFQKLFQITLVLFFVAVSIAVLGLLITAIMSAVQLPMLARGQGIVFVVGGVSERLIRYMIIAASLVIAGFYLFFRRRRFRR